jgi:hypothetical protein
VFLSHGPKKLKGVCELKIRDKPYIHWSNRGDRLDWDGGAETALDQWCYKFRAALWKGLADLIFAPLVRITERGFGVANTCDRIIKQQEGG